MAKQTAGDSTEQCNAELHMLTELSKQIGHELKPRPVDLPDGHAPRVDGVCDSPFVLCEARAHQGRPKGAQPKKVMADALKLLYIERVLDRPARKILLFSDSDAAAPFLGDGWQAHALRTFDVEVHVVDIDPDVAESVRAAQDRQHR